MNKTIRNSNFELMRILCIVFIIAYHYALHACSGTLSSKVGSPSLTGLIINLLSSWQWVGNYGFVAISSYFLCRKTNFKSKKLIYLYLQTIFYCIIFTAGYVVFIGKNSLSFAFQELSTPLNDQYWFLTSYIIFYLISPLLYKAANAVSLKQLKGFCILFPFILVFFSNQGGNLIFFCYIYFLVALVNRTEQSHIKQHCRKLLAGTTLIITIVLIIIYYWSRRGASALIIQTLLKINVMLSLLDAIWMLYCFERIHLSPNSFINTLGKSIFGIYIIHENYIMYSSDISSSGTLLWDKILGTVRFTDSPLIILHMVISVIVVFAVCCCIDIIRAELLEKRLVSKIKLIDTICAKFDRFYSGETSKEAQ